MTEVYLLPLKCEFADTDEVLGDFGVALLALVSNIPRPVDEILIDLLQRFLIVLTQFYLSRTHTHTFNRTLPLTSFFAYPDLLGIKPVVRVKPQSQG